MSGQTAEKMGSCVLTHEKGVGLGHRHDTHDGWNAAPKCNQPFYGMPRYVPESPSWPAMNPRGLTPCERGQVQLVDVI